MICWVLGIGEVLSADADGGGKAVELFKKREVYGEKFEEARERRRKVSVGGVGGTKGASELL